MRKRSSKGGGAQRSIQVHLMVNEEEAAMIRAAARKRNQTVSLTIIEAVKLLEGSLYVEEEEHDSPTVQALREIEYQLRRIGRNVNQIAHNANREMNATIEDEASASYAVRQCRELIDHLDAVIGQSGGVPDDANRSEEGQALRTVRLQSLDFFDEPGERHGFSLDQVVIGFLDYLGHDQVDVQFIELGELGMGHVAGSQGEQVFVPDPVGFVGDLAETILDGCFRGEHTQLFLGERRILVGGLRGEQEIGFLSVFRLGLRLVFDAARVEDAGDMDFEDLACAAHAPVAHGGVERSERVNVDDAIRYEWRGIVVVLDDRPLIEFEQQVAAVVVFDHHVVRVIVRGVHVRQGGLGEGRGPTPREIIGCVDAMPRTRACASRVRPPSRRSGTSAHRSVVSASM